MRLQKAIYNTERSKLCRGRGLWGWLSSPPSQALYNVTEHTDIPLTYPFFWRNMDMICIWWFSTWNDSFLCRVRLGADRDASEMDLRCCFLRRAVEVHPRDRTSYLRPAVVNHRAPNSPLATWQYLTSSCRLPTLDTFDHYDSRLRRLRMLKLERTGNLILSRVEAFCKVCPL